MGEGEEHLLCSPEIRMLMNELFEITDVMNMFFIVRMGRIILT